MFSIIITVVSIALVSVLALATLYYGGDIFSNSSQAAIAATLDAQAQQVHAASVLYYQDTGTWPANTVILMASGYLTAAPIPPASSLRLTAQIPVEALAGIPKNICPSLEACLTNPGLGDVLGYSAADVSVLAQQLNQMAAQGKDALASLNQIVYDKGFVSKTGQPTALEYTWGAANAQLGNPRIVSLPLVVTQATCEAVNVVERKTKDIPVAYTAAGGPIQCFGDATTGYSYVWFSGGTGTDAVTTQVAALGLPVDSPVIVAGGAGTIATSYSFSMNNNFVLPYGKTVSVPYTITAPSNGTLSIGRVFPAGGYGVLTHTASCDNQVLAPSQSCSGIVQFDWAATTPDGYPTSMIPGLTASSFNMVVIRTDGEPTMQYPFTETIGPAGVLALTNTELGVIHYGQQVVVTLVNTSAADRFYLASVTQASPLEVVASACPANTWLEPGQSCQVTVTHHVGQYMDITPSQYPVFNAFLWYGPPQAVHGHFILDPTP